VTFLRVNSKFTLAPLARAIVTSSHSHGISPVDREVANGLIHTFTKDCNQMRLNGTVNPMESKEIGIGRMASPLAKVNSEFVRRLEIAMVRLTGRRRQQSTAAAEPSCNELCT